MTHLDTATAVPLGPSPVKQFGLPEGWEQGDIEQLVSELTRRRILRTSVAAALLASLPGRIGAQGTPEALGWPRTVTGSLGEVVIPTKPERILCISDWGEVDYLIAMGVEPAIYGFTNRYGQGVSPWLAAMDVEALETFDLDISSGPDLEVVVAAQPDLIISEPHFAEPVLDQLQTIAPTLGVPTTFTGATWRDAQRTLGVACGTEQAAADAIAKTDDVIAAGKDQLSALADRTVTIAYFSAGDDGNTYSVVPISGAGLIEELGLAYDALGSEDAFEQRSMETVNELDAADLLVVIDFGLSDSNYSENPLYQGLTLVQEGRVTQLDIPPTRAFWGQTTLSVRWVVPFLVEAIETAVQA